MAIETDGLHYIGIEKILFDPNQYGKKQIEENWCWAACIEMLFNFYGLEFDQKTIVKSTFGCLPGGHLPDVGADAKTIHQKLNEVWVDADGLAFKIESKYHKGAPPALSLINELMMKNPVIAGYNTGNSYMLY